MLKISSDIQSFNVLKLFKKIIIIFWTLWWLIALWTDVVGILAHNGWLNQSWAPDTNYPFLVDSLKMYQVSPWVPQLCFAGIIMGSLFATLAFLWTVFALNKPFEVWIKRANVAFVISMCFWFAFFLADQLVMKFDLEENHMVQGEFLLLTYCVLYFFSDNVKDS